MFDCANVEMRELLPELAAGALDVATRSRVEAHVAACSECASELETLRLVRGAYGVSPAVDVSRIVAALPKPAVASPRGARPVRRWVDWRIAAALTTITMGGLSVAVARRMPADGDHPGDTAVVAPSRPAVNGTRDGALVVGRTPDTSRSPENVTPRGATPAAAARVQLTFGGGVEDLDDDAITALLGALDEIDRAPVAPLVEPDRSPALPVIPESTR